MTPSLVRITHDRKEPDGPQEPIIAELGRHIRTDPSKLAKYCYKTLGTVSEDVATIVEAVALSDRLCPRRRSKGWARAISLEIPVFNPKVFETQKNNDALIDTLNFLTGDAWALEFTKRSDPPLREEYLPLVRDPPKYVVPYSNGLDSFAQARLLQADHGENRLLKVRAGTLEDTDSRIDVPVLRVRRGFQMGRVREQSYRTRPLVFYCFAAIAAVTAEAEAVVIGESGQGSLGPSFAIYADEWPLRSSHPGFLFRLQTFLTQVLGVNVTFLQPQLWRTKGQVLQELKDRGLQAGWEKTKSCSLRPRDRRERGACGFCGGCTLRRVSAMAAGLTDESDYAFDAASSILNLTEKAGGAAPMSLNDRQIFVRAVGSMAIVADVLDQPDASETIARELADLPSPMRSAGDAEIRKLLRQHSSEWRDFLSNLPKSAWLSERFLKHA